MPSRGQNQREIDGMERTYKALIEASHAQAKKSGWWDDGIENRSLDEQFNNFHAEVSEAWEQYRDGKMATWYSHHGKQVGDSDRAEVDGMMQCNIAALHKTEPEWAPAKPEGFFVELADLIIRLADTCGAYEIADLNLENECFVPSDPAALIAALHREIEGLREQWTKYVFTSWGARYRLSLIFGKCFEFAKDNGADLWVVIEEKAAYNATRSHRHGGKRA